MSEEVQKNIDEFYRKQAAIYNFTRPFFLFGRKNLVETAAKYSKPDYIMDAGCGTGYLLPIIESQFPDSRITALDRSEAMLSKAKKINLKRTDFHPGDLLDYSGKKIDLIFLSYSLTMSPDYSFIVPYCGKLLNSGGKIAVCDFLGSRFSFYRNFMQSKHVAIENNLPELLRRDFETEYSRVEKAYFGIWNYFTFIGRKID
jgi:S-adenosylmethionine-diacylgycerolhomoserine-N-methlytransferase